MNRLIQHININQEGFLDFTQITIRQGSNDAANLGTTSATSLLKSLVPNSLSIEINRERDAAVQHTLQRTARIQHFLQSIGKTTEHNLKTVISDNLLNGKGPREAASAIQSVLDSSQSYALMVSRTEILSAYRGAQLTNFKANSDIVDGWIWNCALDLRSCAYCIGLHGSFHTLDEDMETHPNCACDMIPHTRSWNDLLEANGIDSTADIADTNPVIPSGESWFNSLSAADQQSILGPAKYNALQSGDIQFSDLIGDGGEASLKSLGLDAADYLNGGD